MTTNPQWQGVTLYLVTTRNPQAWAAHERLRWAARDMAAVLPEDDPHVWEFQIGQAPVDVTEEARKLLEGKQ